MHSTYPFSYFTDRYKISAIEDPVWYGTRWLDLTKLRYKEVEKEPIGNTNPTLYIIHIIYQYVATKYIFVETQKIVGCITLQDSVVSLALIKILRFYCIAPVVWRKQVKYFSLI
jgi:hypothetical protein